jgi:hypothetical protein
MVRKSKRINEKNFLNQKIKMPYWLHGGIIGILIQTILAFLFFSSMIFFPPLAFLLNKLNQYIFFIMIPVYEYFMYNSLFCPELGRNTSCGNPILAIIFTILTSVVIYFIIGALIGWVYKFFKHNK